MSKNKRINKVVLAALMTTVAAGSLVYASCANGKDGSNDNTNNTIVPNNTITKKLSFTKEDSFFNEVDYLKKAYQNESFYGIYVNVDAKDGTLLDEVEDIEEISARYDERSASYQEWQKALKDIYPGLKKYSKEHNVNRISVELETGLLVGSGIRYMNLDNLEVDKMESKEKKALLSLKDRGYNSIIEASYDEIFLIKDTLFGNSKFKHFNKMSLDRDDIKKTSLLSRSTIQDAITLLDDNFISTWYSDREDIGSESPVVWADYIKDEDSKEFILEDLTFTDNGVHYSKNKKDLEEAQIIELLEKNVVLNDDLKNSNTKICVENYDPNSEVRFKEFTYIQQTQE